MSNTPATTNQKELAVKPIDRLKTVMASESVQQQFKNAMGENSNLLVAQIIDLYASDRQLQKCEPSLVVGECLKAATLKLPVNRSLGFAWIIARFNNKENAYIPQFQPGWKGIVQLAQRTGQYKYINCGPVFEGELRSISKLTGVVDIDGEAVSDEEVGYFAYIELMNGFSKTLYWSKAKVEAHAIKYNPECKKAGKLANVWKEHFASRAQATVLKHLIQKYGIMSIEMQAYMKGDEDIKLSHAGQLDDETGNLANQGEIIDIDPEGMQVNTDTGEVTKSNEVSGDGSGHKLPPVEETKGQVQEDGPSF